MDFISVTCYDQFPYESNVNHHAPLTTLEQDTGYDANINIVSKIHAFKINLLYSVSIFKPSSKVTNNITCFVVSTIEYVWMHNYWKRHSTLFISKRRLS